jgi:hypothetical protein
MGTTKENLKPKTKQGADFFDGIKNLVRSKKTDVKSSAKSYVDLLQEIEKRNSELILVKSQDIKNETDRYDYNRKILTELQIQETLIQQTIESVARAAVIAEEEGH